MLAVNVETMKPNEIELAWNGTEKCLDCGIRNLVLFADLRREDFELLHLPIDDIELPAGDILYRESDRPQFVYTVRSGLLKLVRFFPDGSYRIVRLLRRGDLAGIEALNGVPYLQQAVALRDCTLCRIPKDNVDRLNARSPRLYRQLTRRWHNVQSDADRWLTEFAVGNARRRLAKLLLYLAEDAGNGCFLPAREDIGAILAISTETASRMVAEFNRQGLIEIRRQYASIDKPALEDIR